MTTGGKSRQHSKDCVYDHRISRETSSLMHAVTSPNTLRYMAEILWTEQPGRYSEGDPRSLQEPAPPPSYWHLAGTEEKKSTNKRFVIQALLPAGIGQRRTFIGFDCTKMRSTSSCGSSPRDARVGPRMPMSRQKRMKRESERSSQ